MKADDLIRDEPLDRMSDGRIGPELDSLNHRVVAHRIAELATLSHGHLNVALFGPWGSGKSSFYGLMKEELKILQKDTFTVRFDAWKNSGPGFHANFLHDLAEQVPHADKDIAKRLFQTRKTVSLPSSLKESLARRSTKGLWWKVLPGLATWFFGFPALWALLPAATGSGRPYLEIFWESVANWFTITYAPAILLLVINMIIELSKISIEESAPGNVSQFGILFDEVVGSKNRRYVIFIDELDRCAPEDVLQTLEGLRTFLGHRNCVFVVAFDRKAVASTIGKNLHAKVPNRPDRPYYSTAGEYLDKIFQFQISLPPQPPHTFRKYAFSLVKDRGGIWRELDPRVLARVVSILAPLHVSSPRRTKVLLNDFAVHLRILESLGFDAKGRAEEIAALTVIQTEFPTLAADLEIEPGLLRSLAEQTLPARPALKDLYKRYVDDGGTVGLDEVIGDRSTDGDSALQLPSTGETERVEAQLLLNLRRFLRLLQDIRCPLPSADLILMHSDGDLLSFDDPSVYNTVLLAADLPVEDVLNDLHSCTPQDSARAVEYLLEHVEGETPAEAAKLVMIAGELIGQLAPEAISRLAEPLIHGWEQVTSNDRTEANRFSASSLTGFVACQVAVGTQDSVFSFYETVKEFNHDSAVPVLVRIIDEAPPEDPNYQELLAAEAAAVALHDAVPLARFVRRQDCTALPTLIEEFALLSAESFTVEPPETLAAASGTSAAQLAIREENESLQARFVLEVSEAAEEFDVLLREWSEYSVDGSARSWIYQLLLKIAPSHEWAFERHDTLIQDDFLAGLGREANQQLLLALTAHPERADRGWSSLLQAETRTDARLQEAAMEKLINCAVDEALPASVRSMAAEAARGVSRCIPESGELNTDEILRAIGLLVDRGWESGDDAYFSLARTLIDAAGEVGADTKSVLELKTRVYSAATSSADEPDELKFIMYALREEPADVLTSVAAAALSVVHGDNISAVLVAVACHNRLHELDSPAAPVSAESIATVLATSPDTPLLQAWIQTGPSFADLGILAGKGIAVFSSPAETWKKYATRSSAADRSEVWVALRTAKASQPTLKAIAVHGVESWLYGDLVDELVAATNSDGRRDQHQRLLTLPTENAHSATGAVRLAEKLAARARRTDAPIAASYLLANQKSLTKTQKATVLGTAGSWISDCESSVGKHNMKKLREIGIVPEKTSWFQIP